MDPGVAKMKILIITNLYPPQELGGYGRSMADFAWGLQQRGHQIHVLSSDTPHLGSSSDKGPSGEQVIRNLVLKGSYKGGLKPIQDEAKLKAINTLNAKTIDTSWSLYGPFDGVLIGNIDLLGIEIIEKLLQYNVKILHHIGFMNPPYNPSDQPRSKLYQLVGASHEVSRALEQVGMRNNIDRKQSGDIPVVYPGVRSDLFGERATGRKLPSPLEDEEKNRLLGTRDHPLRICFAGLLMASKGAHTLVEALVKLKEQGVEIQGHLAGDTFQAGYRETLEEILRINGLDEVRFTGQLNKASLARFFRLHHICVFPSIHPEAFGIVGAEAMASGLVLISSCVGGAGELIKDRETGIKFEPGNAAELAHKLKFLCNNSSEMQRIARAGELKARTELCVNISAKKLEDLYVERGQIESKICIF